MAIIYTYPSIPNVQADDCMLISDESDGKKTKSVSLSTLKSFVGGGSAAFLTVGTIDGTTKVNNVIDITVSNGSLADNGNGEVTLTTKTTPGGPTRAVQYHDSTGKFAGSANLVFFDSGQLDLTHRLDLLGDGGTNPGTLRLYCEAGNTHHVEIKGPAHTNGVTYSVQLPNTLVAQAAYPVGSGRILETDSTGIMRWIETPQGGTTVVANPTPAGTTPLTGLTVGATKYLISPQVTSGTWIPTLGINGVGASESLQGRGLATFNNGGQVGTWRRIGEQIYYDFFIEFTITQNFGSAGNLYLGQALSTADGTLYALPVNDDEPGSTGVTVADNAKNNGSCQITETAVSSTFAEAMWPRLPVTGKVGRHVRGLVSLSSHNYATLGPTTGAAWPAQSTIYNQVWWTTDDPVVCTVAGTIIAQVTQAS